MRWLGFGTGGTLALVALSFGLARSTGLAFFILLIATGGAMALTGTAIQYYTPTGRPSDLALFAGKFRDPEDELERRLENRERLRPVVRAELPLMLEIGRALTFAGALCGVLGLILSRR